MATGMTTNSQLISNWMDRDEPAPCQPALGSRGPSRAGPRDAGPRRKGPTPPEEMRSRVWMASR